MQDEYCYKLLVFPILTHAEPIVNPNIVVLREVLAEEVERVRYEDSVEMSTYSEEARVLTPPVFALGVAKIAVLCISQV